MNDKRVRIMVVNAQAASASDAHTTHVVNKSFNLAEKYAVDIIVWSEVGDVHVPTLGQKADASWYSHQYGSPNQDQPQAGLAMSWNKNTVDLDEFSRSVGSKATSEGRWKTGAGIRERSILSCTIVEPIDVRLHGIHPPPKRALRARASYMRNALKKAGILAGDSNFIHIVLTKMSPRRNVTSVGLLTVITPKRFWVSKPTKVDVDSDHLAFYVDIEPKKPRASRLRRKAKKR